MLTLDFDNLLASNSYSLYLKQNKSHMSQMLWNWSFVLSYVAYGYLVTHELMLVLFRLDILNVICNCILAELTQVFRGVK